MTAPAVPTTDRHVVSHDDAELRFDTDDATGLRLSGYAAVFNQKTRIANAWEGDFTEVIAPGAFARAVRANPRPKLQYDHGANQSFAIGAIRSMREDAKGLFIEADLHDDWTTEPIRNGIKSGAIDGMSFRFRPAEGGEDWSPDRSTRTLTDVDVFELGPVLYPAYSGTEVSVRAAQMVEALTDPTAQELAGEMATALVIANRHQDPADTADVEARAVEPPADDVDEVRTDEQTIEADQDSPLSAPNPAIARAVSFQIRAAQALQRSNIDPPGLPID